MDLPADTQDDYEIALAQKSQVMYCIFLTVAESVAAHHIYKFICKMRECVRVCVSLIVSARVCFCVFNFIEVTCFITFHPTTCLFILSSTTSSYNFSIL